MPLLWSANPNRWSFRLNFEFSVESYGSGLASALSVWLDGLIAAAEPVTLEQIDSRPAWWRFRDGLAKILSPQL